MGCGGGFGVVAWLCPEERGVAGAMGWASSQAHAGPAAHGGFPFSLGKGAALGFGLREAQDTWKGERTRRLRRRGVKPEAGRRCRPVANT